jgi:exodeoxyribonuclease V alpha subunit
MATYYSGRVNNIIYENNGFYILKMTIEDDSTIDLSDGTQLGINLQVVKGNIPGLEVQIGTWVGFEGKVVNDKKYGEQIQITRAPVLPKGQWDQKTAISVLKSNGVGFRVCNELENHFGDKVLEALEDPKRLLDSPHVTPFLAEFISNKWQSVRALYQTMFFLRDLGITKARTDKIWAHFGSESERVLSMNPWALVKIDGFTFRQADEIAHRLGLDLNDPKHIRNRKLYGVLYTSKSQRGMGHLYINSSKLFKETKRVLPTLTEQEVRDSVAECVGNELLVLDDQTRPGEQAVYEPWSFQVEQQGSVMLKNRHTVAKISDPSAYMEGLAGVGPQTQALVNIDSDFPTVIHSAIDEWCQMSNLSLSETQKQGVFNALTEPVSIITGLPGTGKSTSLKVAVKVLQDMGVRFLLVAPTGIAAKRMNQVTNAPAYTIHRAFGARNFSSDTKRESSYKGIEGKGALTVANGAQESWEYSPENPHTAQVVFIDESSMLDQSLLYRIMYCTSAQCRLVFVGDAAQLPSVGPGNVLRDMINSKLFPTTNLTEIFRQVDTSGIVQAAHDIHGGITPNTTSSKDFILIPAGTDDEVLKFVKQVVQKMYDRRKQFQVISPRHAGTIGVTNLNSHLREMLNPKRQGVAEFPLGDDIIREGDRVMVIRNNYDLEVFNGDIGKVNRINRKDRYIEVKIHEVVPRLIRFPFSKIKEHLRLAYACTVHKTQGLEFEMVVMPITMSLGGQLQRNLLYTAITRAKKKAVLVGSNMALAKAVGNNKEDLRNTLFLDRLLKDGG